MTDAEYMAAAIACFEARKKRAWRRAVADGTAICHDGTGFPVRPTSYLDMHSLPRPLKAMFQLCWSTSTIPLIERRRYPTSIPWMSVYGLVENRPMPSEPITPQDLYELAHGRPPNRTQPVDERSAVAWMLEWIRSR